MNIVRVESVEIINLDDPIDVYDIEVELDHSFSIHGIVAHNSNLCRSLDSKIFPVGKAPMPPYHHLCRTTTSAVIDSRFSILDEDATRAARDEDGEVISVDANETYYSWLKKQSKSFQDSVIGPTRGKLLREGGLSAERFAELNIGRNFEPLNLEAMRKLEPLAFERAGL
ncbi:hypothetical protein [Nitrosomonas communis]|uniref:hypothetical protein n=1 Tax=Nitrosomonas communis TaxID=44574 RepID=UPI0026EF14F5|nr:hypothetical protein [Nitrosomonas communis]MCO6427259.1 hypothetical protein [Nitrosomonas communis]